MSTSECNSTSIPVDCTQTSTQTPTPVGSSQAPTSVDNSLPFSNENDVKVVSLVNQGRLRSVVWKHFVKTKINGLDKAICNYCKKALGGKSRNGTKHLHDHYECCPVRKALAETKQDAPSPSLMKGEGKRKLEAYTFEQEFARKELGNMIIMHEYPLSIVEHIGFRRYSYALQPLYKMVSRNTIKSDILKIYDFEKMKTLKLIEKNQSRVAVTTDMWTSNNQKRGFMVITAHFIDDSWKLQSRIIRFAYVPCPHTAEVLCDVLVETFFDWNFDRKLSTITIDNCTSNDAMIPIFLGKLDPCSLLLSGSLFHMRCAAHILNLIVKDGLNVIKEGIEKIRESVGYWTATPKREEKFEETARQLHVSYSKKLCLDCVTRWNSTFLMLQTAIEYKVVFARLKNRESQYKISMKDSDWEFAREICGKLQIFYNTTELFSGTKYPTSNLFFPKICEIKIALSRWVVSSNEVVKTMALNMIAKYDKYWSVIHGILGVAVVLDPRYKMNLIEYYFEKIYGDNSYFEIERIRQLCYDLLKEYQFKLGHVGDSSNHLDSGSRDQDELNDFDLFISSKKRCKTLNVKSEMDNYLEEDVLPRSQDFDILAWWKSNGLKYPTLQAIARDVLAIPISTVASESAFSTSGRVVSPQRSRLHPKTLEALMCAQSWLWAIENEEETPVESKISIGFATINDEEVDEDGGESIVTDLMV